MTGDPEEHDTGSGTPREAAPGTGAPRAIAPILLLALLWGVAVPAAGALAVLGLRAAGGDDTASVVLSAEEAVALAADTTPSPSASPAPSTPTPSASPPASPSTSETPSVTSLGVPGAVLGVRCQTRVPVLVWSVPDPGWRVEESRTDGTRLRVRLESEPREVEVTVVCSGETPVLAEVERGDEE